MRADSDWCRGLGGRATVIPIAFFVVVASSACRTPETGPADELQIVTSLPVIASIIRGVSGELAEVHVLLPRNASAHDYMPRPSDVLAARAGDIELLAHPHVDGWASEFREDPAHFIADWLSDPGLAADGRAESDLVHFWMDPGLVLRTLEPLASMLCEKRPRDCGKFHENASRFADMIMQTETELRIELARLGSIPVVASHPFLVPFARRFNIRINAVIEGATGREPSPADIIRIIEGVRAENAQGVVANRVLPDHFARLVAHETGIGIAYLDPGGGDSATYMEFLKQVSDCLLSFQK